MWDLTISNQPLTTIVSMQTAQLDQMERMFQTHLNNTQMACRTGVPRRTEAPSLTRRDAGGLGAPVRGCRSRCSRMEDVD